MDKKEINIVIVEDDSNQMDAYISALSEFNNECSYYIIKHTSLENDDKLPEILYKNRIDAIIIDLDWGSGRQGAEGSALVDHIIEHCRIPVFVVSGNLGLLNTNMDESPIFKKYDRGDVIFDDLYGEIVELYSTGYTNVVGNHGLLDKNLADFFWKHLSSSIFNWKDYDDTIKFQRMLRFATTRINELLTFDSDNKHDEYDAHEFYIKPSPHVKPFTGDIIKYEDNTYIVLTASCDMEQKKFDFAVLASVDFKMFEEIYTGLRKTPPSNTKQKELAALVNNSKNRYHLLPPCDSFNGAVIDFQRITNIDKSNLYENAIIVSSINPVFSKDIQARFSQYYGRQGQPQLSLDSINNWITKS